MNKYERYAVRQILLNQLYPPSENNKVLGSRTMFDVMNAWAFFTFNNDCDCEEERQERRKQPKPQPVKKELTEEEKQELERQRLENLHKLQEFMNKKTYNPFIIFAQIFMKYITGCIVNFAKATGRLDN